MQDDRMHGGAMIPVAFQSHPALPAWLPFTTAGALALTPGHDDSAVLCGLALAALLFAAVEQRPRAMLAAGGIAIGLTPGGIILAPVAIGLAIRHQLTHWLILLPVTAVATWLAIGGEPGPTALPSLYSVAVAHLAVAALVAAAGIGLAAWTTAEASSRARHGHRLLVFATINALSLALFVPTAIETLALLIVLLAAARLSHGPLVRAANDEPIIPRGLRVAA